MNSHLSPGGVTGYRVAMPPELICIGHACWDLVLPVPEFPCEDGKQEIPAMSESGGGPAANAACLAAAWGVRTEFCGWVGDDSRGGAVRDDFHQRGVGTALLRVESGRATPTSVILVNAANGSRTIVNAKPPAPALAVGVAAFRGVGLAPSGALLSDGHEPRAAAEALDAFPHVMSVLDAGSVREGTLALAPRVTHLAASARFVRQLVKCDAADEPERALRALRAAFPGPESVVITLGAGGLVAERAGETVRLPAKRVAVVDTTAAGDFWHGAFAAALVRGWGWRAALELATDAASESVTRAGGRASLPSAPVPGWFPPARTGAAGA